MNRKILAVSASLAVIGVVASFEVQAQTVAGVTPGALSVEQSGAASYSIPLSVPPGTGGMAPSLSLNYGSQGGNGLLGVGWSLGGLSVIHRCPTTLEQDGFIDGVDYDGNDKLCLDGQRLVAISGTYGADGTEYRTEIDGFAKIVSHGVAGTGPASFTVWTKSGQIMAYGASADSAIEAQGRAEVRIWAVNKIADTVGNYLTVSYFEDNAAGEYRPTRIDYTGNAAAGLTPSNSVRFTYEARSDLISLYAAGGKVQTTQRLTSIETYEGANLVRDYRLTYDNGGAVGRSRVTGATECDGVGDCLNPMSFGWQDPASGFETQTRWFQSPNNLANMPRFANGAGGDYNVLLDMNGDGLPDRVGHYNYVTGQGYGLWVALNTGSGFAPQALWFQSPQNLANMPRFADDNGSGDYNVLLDMNGDGLPDRVGHYNYVTGQGYGLWVALSLVAPDLLTSITDSLGAVTALSYKPITDSVVYAKSSGAAYPERDLQAPLYVVSQVSRDDGLGGQAVTSYTYGGAKAHLRGRGYLGFAWMEVTDQQSGIVTRTDYRQDFPYTGQVTASKTYMPDAAGEILVKRLSNTWAAKSLNGGATQAPYVAASTAEAFEFNDGVQP